jgi:hypothetical protein
MARPGQGEPVVTDYAIPIALGVSLAAATGFRVFVPLLITGLAMRAGYAPTGDTFAWVASTPALAMLCIAAITEVAAYYVPGVDNALDAIATPAATLAGIAVSAAMMTDLPPMLKWSLAIIAGGGAAAVTQTTTAFLRTHSTLFTGGLGNHLLSTFELLGAGGIAVLALLLPVVAFVLVVVFLLLIWRIIRRVRKGLSPPG